MLIKALKELAQAANTQILLTTHSPVIVKELDFENLRLIFEDEVGKRVLSVEPAVLQYPSLNEVNYAAYGEATSDFPVSLLTSHPDINLKITEFVAALD